MKKSEFKSIVKECLMEILSEGIGNLNNNQHKNIQENKNNKQNQITKQPQQIQNKEFNKKNDIKNKLLEQERQKQVLLKQKKDLMLKLGNNSTQNNKNQIQNKQHLIDQKNVALNRLKDDHKSVMMSIFEDTAKNTPAISDNIPANIVNGSSKEQMIVNNSTPEELFGEDVANRWASLAFFENQEDNNKK